MVINSFTAVCRNNSHTLVLGSVPGVASLEAEEYYAHKRNAFWPIIISITTNTPPSYEQAIKFSYDEKLQLALNAGIALWDVVEQCQRPGSLDSNIKQASANDFLPFFDVYKKINRVIFNGRTAAALFKKHVAKESTFPAIEFHTLPSTSPAMAQLTLEQKTKTWQPYLT